MTVTQVNWVVILKNRIQMNLMSKWMLQAAVMTVTSREIDDKDKY